MRHSLGKLAAVITPILIAVASLGLKWEVR
jgi:hypothetical protein